jgi:hypothetical protein
MKERTFLKIAISHRSVAIDGENKDKNVPNNSIYEFNML